MSINDGRVVSNFIVQALQNHNITMYGEGLQTRSFCYVDDLVDGIINFMNYQGNDFGPINLGNPGEFKIIELAQKVIKLTNSESKIIYQDLPINDPLQRKPNIDKARSLIKFSPKIDLESGLIRTIEYFKKLL